MSSNATILSLGHPIWEYNHNMLARGLFFTAFGRQSLTDSYHLEENPVIDWVFLLSLIRILTLLSNLDTLKDTLRIMNPSYFTRRKSGSSYLFRSVVPLDLQPILESRQFQLSLSCGILRQSKRLSFHPNQVTISLSFGVFGDCGNNQLPLFRRNRIFRSWREIEF